MAFFFKSGREPSRDREDNSILVPVGEFPRDLLDLLSRKTAVSIARERFDPSFALNTARNQYDSTKLIAGLKARYGSGRVVGATACDLFIPVLTFVFGEAEMPGRAAIFSIHRLRQEYYGLPPDRELLAGRALRELRHECGHLSGLSHCPDWSCVMSSSHSVERVDSKEDWFCTDCLERLGLFPQHAAGI